jgi:hypothetical protein
MRTAPVPAIRVRTYTRNPRLLRNVFPVPVDGYDLILKPSEQTATRSRLLDTFPMGFHAGFAHSRCSSDRHHLEFQ